MNNKEQIEQLKTRLVELVESIRPIKATEIPTHLNAEEIKLFTPAIMDELVKEERITEVEYVLPMMPNRIKSIYFPLGTEITIVKDI